MAFSQAVFLLISLGVAFAALPADFQKQTAKAKQDLLWQNILKDAYTSPASLPVEGPSALQSVKALWAPYLTRAFLNEGDEMEEGRLKLLHPLGTVAKVQLNIFPNSTYTGVFGAGSAAIGLARLSLARFDYSNVMPGVGLKLLIDGKQSQNFHLMQNLEGNGPVRDFFVSHPTNKYPDPDNIKIKIVGKVFDAGVALLPAGPKGTDRPLSANTLGLQEQSAVKSDGTVESKVVAPFRLELVPNAQVAKLFAGRDKDDFRTVLGDIKDGTVLYDVLAQKDDALTTKKDFIGQIVTQSKFVASPYGDNKLYLQHASKRWQQ